MIEPLGGTEIRIKIKITIRSTGEGEFAFEGEFFAAELEFLFLNGGVAFADVGVFGLVDEGPKVFEHAEVFGIGIAIEGDGEVEGLLLEDFEGGGREEGDTGDGVFADFGGGFFGVGEVGNEGAGGAALVVALEGGLWDLDLEIGFAEVDEFFEGLSVVEPGVDVHELAVGETLHAREWAAGFGTAAFDVGAGRRQVCCVLGVRFDCVFYICVICVHNFLRF